MNKSFGLKLLGALGVGAALTLTACGGGGGDSGTPLVPPTAKLRMTPNITGLTLTVGQFVQPTTISGGEKDYHITSTDCTVIPSLLEDGTVTLLAIASTNSCSGPTPPSSSASSSGSASGGTVQIQDSSYRQTTLEFSIFVDPSPGALFSSLTNAGIAKITLNPGQSQTFTVYGTAPYSTISGNPVVANFSGGISGNSANGVITVTAGATSGNTTIVVVDNKGLVLVLPVQVGSP